jgi:hypothetical protein
MLGCLLSLTGGGLAIWFLRSGENHHVVKAAQAMDGDAMREDMKAAEAVALDFLKETDPAKRLQWVRNAEEVKEQLVKYPEEARSEVGEIEKVLGHQLEGTRSVTGFVVAFPSGNLRLLEVVGTPEGPRVDWDSYARYGSASWGDLWSGNSKQAVMRGFASRRPSGHEPFEDQGKWTCFRMIGPELPRAALGFAQVGHVRKEMMLFEIIRCLAVGWIIGERDVEDDWMKRVESFR